MTRRRAAKLSIDEFKRKRSNVGDDMNKEEMITSSLKIVDQAWKQNIKYSLMSCLWSPVASDDTEQGKALRQSLKDVWGKHGKCDSIKAYFGNSLVTEIEDFLKMIQTKTAVTAARGPKAKRRKN